MEKIKGKGNLEIELTDGASVEIIDFFMDVTKVLVKKGDSTVEIRLRKEGRNEIEVKVKAPFKIA